MREKEGRAAGELAMHASASSWYDRGVPCHRSRQKSTDHTEVNSKCCVAPSQVEAARCLPAGST